jgi:DNA-binding IclR family transcriptional regulator
MMSAGRGESTGVKNSEPTGQIVRALDKALRVLELLAQVEGDIDLGELASRAGLPKSTLVRLLNTLRVHNVVQQDVKTRRYRLGWALIHLGKAAERQFDLAKILHPFLEQLAKATGETASFAMLDGNHAIYLGQVLSQSIIRGVPPIGSDLGLHCTAVGKVLLSAASHDHIDHLISEYGLPRLTEKTIVNAEHLRRELAEVSEKGYALDNEEAEHGGRCIAAPVRDSSGHTIAAISITGPTSRISLERVGEYAEIVKRVGQQASETLGAQGVSVP